MIENFYKYQLQHKDLARENERAAEIAADLASQMIGENHAPVEGLNCLLFIYVIWSFLKV